MNNHKTSRKAFALLASFALLFTTCIGSAFADTPSIDASDLEQQTISVPIKVEIEQSSARDMLNEINEFRTSDTWYWNEDNSEQIEVKGLQPLSYSIELERVAKVRALEICLVWAHERPNNNQTFVALTGTTFHSWGENLAAGTGGAFATAEAANDGLEEENELYEGQGHRRNLLRPEFKCVGIAHVTFNGCDYWVQEFGAPTDDTEMTEAESGTIVGNVEVSTEHISDFKITTSVESLALRKTKALPTATVKMRLYETWPSRLFPTEYETHWISDDESIVTIENGKIIAHKTGTTSITAINSDFGLSKSVKVTVVSVPKMKTPTLSKGTYENVRMSWYRWNNVSGYQVSRSTKKTGTYTIGYANSASTKTVEFDSTKGKTYYYKVRAYKTVDGQRVYGAWSEAVKYVAK